MHRAALCLVALSLVTAPAHADWLAGIYKDGDGADMAVMQGTGQYDFKLFLYCKKDGEQHVILQWGTEQTPVEKLKAANDVTLTVKIDDTLHTSIGQWPDYGGDHPILEYSNVYDTVAIARDIAAAKDIVTFIYDSPSLKVHEGAVSYADGAATAAKTFLDFCTF
ncbi:MAG TPA: hypothetical protein VHA70_08060 [Bauldia sp.]|nr:hypothetical protein [Bauldia sp.]